MEFVYLFNDVIKISQLNKGLKKEILNADVNHDRNESFEEWVNFRLARAFVYRHGCKCAVLVRVRCVSNIELGYHGLGKISTKIKATSLGSNNE